MFEKLIRAAIEHRWLVLLAAIGMAAVGVFSYQKLPIDAVPDIFQAFVAGEANATVELTPNMAGPAFDALDAYLKDKKEPAKWIVTESKLYTPADDPQKVYDEKKGLGY